MYSREITLAFPLITSTGPLNLITVHTLPAKQAREIGKKYDLKNDPDGFNRMDYLFELAVVMTGLEESVLAQLATPDYNSLSDVVIALTQYTAQQLREEDLEKRRAAGERIPYQVPDESDAPELLEPVDDPIAGTITSYRLRPPQVGLTRQVRAERDAHKQGMMVASACSGLHHDVIEQLHMPDFNTLMERVSDFLTEKSDFYRKPTLTD